MLMGLGPGTRDPEEAEDRKRLDVLMELTGGPRKETAPFTQCHPYNSTPPLVLYF